MPCPHVPDVDEDVYFVWLVAHEYLTIAWSRIVESISNPFVPFITAG